MSIRWEPVLDATLVGPPPFPSRNSSLDTSTQVIHQEPVPRHKLNGKHRSRSGQTISFESVLEKQPSR